MAQIKKLSFLLFILLLIPVVSASFDWQVEKIDKGSVIIAELLNPIKFELTITNNGEGDTAEIYSLVGVSMSPKGTFSVPKGTTKIEVIAYPGEEFKKRDGFYSFEYQIRGLTQGIFKDKLAVQVVPLQGVFSLFPIKIHPDDKTADVTIKNNVNANLENVMLEFYSPFFNSSEKITLLPFENLTIPTTIDKKPRLTAGKYTLNAKITLKNSSLKIDTEVEYLEKEKISLAKESSGLLIRETKLTKTNEGNIPSPAEIEITKDIISRLFTTYSTAPDKVERNGLIVKYSWRKDIAPGESFSITTTTNYTFILIIIILIVLIALLVRFYSLTSLTLHKSVSFVRTKGGEFALKVKIRAKARKSVDNITIIDRIPTMTKLYEKSLTKTPDKIDSATRQLFWNIPYLNKGEERLFSYIIYSKLRTVGKFELPSAKALFEKDKKKQQISSNKAYFVSETTEEE